MSPKQAVRRSFALERRESTGCCTIVNEVAQYQRKKEIVTSSLVICLPVLIELTHRVVANEAAVLTYSSGG